MSELVAIKLETCHANKSSCAFYAYFKGEFDEEAVLAAFKNKSDKRVARGVLSPFLDDGISSEEVPDASSRASGLRRFYVCGGC